jgi:hypothetical protein
VVRDRADDAEHGQRPLLSDVVTEAASGRSDTRLYDLPSPLTPTKKAEEEVDAAVTANKGLRGPQNPGWLVSPCQVGAGPAKASIATAHLGEAGKHTRGYNLLA